MTTDLILFDDVRARRWAPFADTRPVGELRYGAFLLRERVERALSLPCVLHLAGTRLEGWDEDGAPQAGSRGAAPTDRARVFWSSRAVCLSRLDIPRDPEPTTLRVGDTTVGWVVPAGQPAPPSAALDDPTGHTTGPAREVEGEILDWPWTLVARNTRRLAEDLEALYGDDDAGTPGATVRLGDHALSMAAGAHVEAGVVLDTRGGPIRLEEGVHVEGPGRLVGPLHLGAHTRVHGGSLARLSAGPVCRLRGEVDCAVLLGYVNKAHDGYLGHALVGRWVNLGALTTNSDLKNSYSAVRIELPDGEEDTGLLKVGVFLGDHVKTGIGTLLTTGAVVGAGSNLFGGGTAPRRVPPFSWGGADGLVPYRLDKFVEVARAAMSRRGQNLTPGVLAALERAWRGEHGTP